jgi:copper chaperone CopZ
LIYRTTAHQENDMLESTPRTFIGATTFQVTGMTCGHCQRAVTEEISRIPGVQGVAVDLPASSVTVTVTQPVDRADIAHAVDEAGYTLIP